MTQITASLVKDLRERTGLGMMECKKALVEADGDIDVAIDNLRKSSAMKAAKKSARIAAEGIIAARVSGEQGVLLEVNSETDFVARDDNFITFANTAADLAIAQSIDSIETLAGNEDINSQREALVQKIGENITLRRLQWISGANLGSYVHGNNKIGVIVALEGGDDALSKDVAMHIAATNPLVANPEDMSEQQLEKEREIYSAQAADSGKPSEIIAKMVEGRLRKFVEENCLVQQAFVKNPDMKVSQLLKNSNAGVKHFVRYEVGEGIGKKEEDFAAEVAAQLKGAS